MKNNIDFMRRSFLGAAALAVPAQVVLGATSTDRSKSGRHSVDPVRDLPMIYRKLRYSMRDEVVAWWFTGMKFGQLNGEFTPLFGVETCNWNRVKSEADGGFTVTVLEAAFYTDLATGEVLRTLKNPYTGQTVEIPYALVGPIAARHDAQSRPLPLSEIGGARLEMNVTVGPAFVYGDDLWASTSNDFRIERKASGRVHRVNEWANYVASAAEVADPAKPSINPSVDLVEITDWPGWFGMGNIPGSIFGRIVGRKVPGLSAMPQKFQRQLAVVFPSVAKDPLTALDAATERMVR